MALLSEALLNRGFLVEKQRSTILLTSEMVLPDDARVLQTAGQWTQCPSVSSCRTSH